MFKRYFSPFEILNYFFEYNKLKNNEFSKLALEEYKGLIISTFSNKNLSHFIFDYLFCQIYNVNIVRFRHFCFIENVEKKTFYENITDIFEENQNLTVSYDFKKLFDKYREKDFLIPSFFFYFEDYLNHLIKKFKISYSDYEILIPFFIKNISTNTFFKEMNVFYEMNRMCKNEPELKLKTKIKDHENIKLEKNYSEIVKSPNSEKNKKKRTNLEKKKLKIKIFNEKLKKPTEEELRYHQLIHSPIENYKKEEKENKGMEEKENKLKNDKKKKKKKRKKKLSKFNDELKTIEEEKILKKFKENKIIHWNVNGTTISLTKEGIFKLINSTSLSNLSLPIYFQLLSELNFNEEILKKLKEVKFDKNIFISPIFGEKVKYLNKTIEISSISWKFHFNDVIIKSFIDKIKLLETRYKKEKINKAIAFSFIHLYLNTCMITNFYPNRYYNISLVDLINVGDDFIVDFNNESISFEHVFSMVKDVFELLNTKLEKKLIFNLSNSTIKHYIVRSLVSNLRKYVEGISFQVIKKPYENKQIIEQFLKKFIKRETKYIKKHFPFLISKEKNVEKFLFNPDINWLLKFIEFSDKEIYFISYALLKEIVKRLVTMNTKIKFKGLYTFNMEKLFL